MDFRALSIRIGIPQFPYGRKLKAVCIHSLTYYLPRVYEIAPYSTVGEVL